MGKFKYPVFLSFRDSDEIQCVLVESFEESYKCKIPDRLQWNIYGTYVAALENVKYLIK
jgi:hypothetical protein